MGSQKTEAVIHYGYLPYTIGLRLGNPAVVEQISWQIPIAPLETGNLNT